MRTIKAEDRLLATHIADNPEFEVACSVNDKETIMSIVHHEMEEHDLYTNGAKKLRDDIFRMLNRKKSCTEVMFFVWNSRLSGTGFAVNAS
jgi:hypothetical protein